MNKPDIIYNNFIKTDFSEAIYVLTSKTDGHTQNYLHWHPHYEIQIIFNGNCTIINNNTVVYSEKPVIYIHSPYSLHSTNANSGQIYHRCVISVNRRVPAMFNSDILDMILFEGVNLLYIFPNPEEVLEFEHITEQMHKYTGNKSVRALCVALIINMVSVILKEGRGTSISRNVTYIQDVLKYISDNIAEPHSVESLAERYNVGKTKFNLDFKNATGSSYKKYLTKLRQTRARELIENGAGIISASLEVGYSSEAHFIKAFRDYWGITPGAFAKQLNLQ